MTLRAAPALMVPVVVLVGIYGGFVTVTEAAALAAVVALLVSACSSIAASAGTQTLRVIADALRAPAASCSSSPPHWRSATG